jgi:hypothetical protein
MKLSKTQQRAVDLMKQGKSFVERKIHDTPSTTKMIYKVGGEKFTEATLRALISKGVIRYYEQTQDSTMWVLVE